MKKAGSACNTQPAHTGKRSCPMTKSLPSPELLRKLLRYEPDTGKLFWKVRPEGRPEWNARYAGKEAMTARDTGGYPYGQIYKRPHRAHRVIWAIVTGAWPKADIDHINGDRSDNRIENLREATRSQNCHNSGLQARNTSGFKGVHFDKRSGRWRSKIMHCGRETHLGLYETPQEAHAAYSDAASRLHGEFSRTS